MYNILYMVYACMRACWLDALHTINLARHTPDIGVCESLCDYVI